MIVNKIRAAQCLLLAASLTACGGGGAGTEAGDADQNVVRTLFAVGDVVEAVEDGGPVDGDVSSNDRGDGLSFALADGSSVENGTLEFNEDGTFIYTPNPDFYGTDSVDYIVTHHQTGETDTGHPDHCGRE